MQDNGWKALFAGICAIIFFFFVAYSFPGMLGGLGGSGNSALVSGNIKIAGTAGSVMFSLNGQEVSWVPGANLIPTCSISVTSTTCLQPSAISNITTLSPFLILFALLAVMFAILMMILFARKAFED